MIWPPSYRWDGIFIHEIEQDFVFNSCNFISILKHLKTVGEKKAVSHGVTNVLEIMLTTDYVQVFNKL